VRQQSLKGAGPAGKKTPKGIRERYNMGESEGGGGGEDVGEKCKKAGIPRGWRKKVVKG